MEESNNKEDKLNNLRIENEIKKMKISLETGASFFSASEKKISPEVEGQFLDQVQQFEDAYAKSHKVLIYDFIGRPAFKSVNAIPKAQIKSELKRIKMLLGQKGVGIDTMHKVEDSELYRFITEELFNEETDNIEVVGMMHNYIYEEFHPNHEHDIKTHSKEFIDSILNKSISLSPVFLSLAEGINKNGEVITEAEAIKKMEVFREAFSSFKLKHFKITSLNRTEDKAAVLFEMEYTGIIEGTNEKKTFSGVGNFGLICENNYWCINKIDVPGITI